MDQVVQQHHAWAKRGGIDFFAMAWSGAGSKHVEWERADMIDKRVIAHLDAGQESGVRSALMYNIRDVVAAGKNGMRPNQRVCFERGPPTRPSARRSH